MDCPHDAIQAIVTPSQEDVLLGFEVPEEGARCDVSLSGDLGDRDALKPFFSLQAHRRIDQRLAGPTLLGFSKPEGRLAHRLSVTRCLRVRRIAPPVDSPAPAPLEEEIYRDVRWPLLLFNAVDPPRGRPGPLGLSWIVELTAAFRQGQARDLEAWAKSQDNVRVETVEGTRGLLFEQAGAITTTTIAFLEGATAGRATRLPA